MSRNSTEDPTIPHGVNRLKDSDSEDWIPTNHEAMRETKIVVKITTNNACIKIFTMRAIDYSSTE